MEDARGAPVESMQDHALRTHAGPAEWLESNAAGGSSAWCILLHDGSGLIAWQVRALCVLPRFFQSIIRVGQYVYV